MQKVVLLGSSGSVGNSSLEVIDKYKEKYEVACLVALSNEDLIKAQAKRHKKAKIYIEKPRGKFSSRKFINKNDLLKLISGKDVDIVIVGRSVDSALALGPLIYEFNWNASDLKMLSSGTILSLIHI